MHGRLGYSAIGERLEEVGALLARMARDENFIDRYRQCAFALRAVLDADGSVWVGGNGGGAAIADHFVGEFVGPRAPHRGRVTSLVGSLAGMTALANDFGFERIFAERIARESSASDALLLFSVSGRSLNILAALDAGSQVGLPMALVSGPIELEHVLRRGLMHLVVPSTTVEAVQAAQLTVAHALVTDLTHVVVPSRA